MTSIAVIGTGPTGIYTAGYLLSGGKSLAITMYESQEEAGKGSPYHQDWNDREMLSNIASIELPPVTETLVDWLRGLSDGELARYGIAREDIAERVFYPRIALGAYFQSQLKALLAGAEGTGNTLAVRTSHRVIDVAMAGDAVEVATRAGSDRTIRREFFDIVVMATGHVWPKESEARPGYFLSPWPSSALGTVGDVHVGIRGTSLSAIDALVALSVARGSFLRDAEGTLEYHPEPGTEGFRATIMSRKGLLPEADFYHPIPYLPLRICTRQAVERLIASGTPSLLDAVFLLFKAELAECDPDYARRIDLAGRTPEDFSAAYFSERERHDPFAWAERNLAEAKADEAREHTVAWRYAILRMHEVIARIVPKLSAEDHARFDRGLKNVFIDDYATVPHESIERLLALHKAGKLDVLRLGEDYTLDTGIAEPGARLRVNGRDLYFPAFIEAMGQKPLSIREFPFPSLWKQGLVREATAPRSLGPSSRARKAPADIGGIDLDATFHPVSDAAGASRLYCLSLPFMLGQYPFAQGITSSHDMGRTVAMDIVRQAGSGGLATSGPAMHAPPPQDGAMP